MIPARFDYPNFEMAPGIEPEPRNARTRSAIIAEPLRIGVERARLWSEAEELASGSPPLVKNALAFKHLCENARLMIRDDERIAGNKTEHLLGLPWFVERGDINRILATEAGLPGPDCGTSGIHGRHQR